MPTTGWSVWKEGRLAGGRAALASPFLPPSSNLQSVRRPRHVSVQAFPPRRRGHWPGKYGKSHKASTDALTSISDTPVPMSCNDEGFRASFLPARLISPPISLSVLSQGATSRKGTTVIVAAVLAVDNCCSRLLCRRPLALSRLQACAQSLLRRQAHTQSLLLRPAAAVTHRPTRRHVGTALLIKKRDVRASAVDIHGSRRLDRGVQVGTTHTTPPCPLRERTSTC